jgi:hypothetical protein
MDITTERLLMGSGGGKDSYWIATLITNSTTTYAYGIGVDSTKNVYISGYGTAADAAALSAKFTPDGSLTWAKLFSFTSATEYSNGLVLDSSDNLYVGGNYYHSFYSVGSIGIAKCDSSTGNFNTIKSWAPSDGSNAFKTAISPSGTIVVSGFTYSSPGYYYASYLAVDSSLNFVFGKNYLFSLSWTDYQFARSITADSAGNFISGCTSYAGSYYVPLIHKIDSFGNTVWGKAPNIANFGGTGIACDSSDNIIFVGYSAYYNGTYNDGIILKFNSSGTILWGRHLYDASFSALFRAVTCDTSGNIYVVGNVTIAGYTAGYIVKFDSTGNVQWQRTLSYPTTDVDFQEVRLSGTSSLCISGYVATSPPRALVFKVPTDGTLTGTYGAYTYASGARSSVSISPSLLSPSFTVGLTLSYANASGSTFTPTTSTTLNPL